MPSPESMAGQGRTAEICSSTAVSGAHPQQKKLLISLVPARAQNNLQQNEDQGLNLDAQKHNHPFMSLVCPRAASSRRRHLWRARSLKRHLQRRPARQGGLNPPCGTRASGGHQGALAGGGVLLHPCSAKAQGAKCPFCFHGFSQLK